MCAGDNVTGLCSLSIIVRWVMEFLTWGKVEKILSSNNMFSYTVSHGLRTPREDIAFTARPKIQSQSQIFRYGGSIFCLPHRPNFSDIFYLCLHWVSVVRGWVPSQLWNGGDFSQAFFDIILGPTTLSFWILFRLGFFPAFHGQNSLLIYHRSLQMYFLHWI